MKNSKNRKETNRWSPINPKGKPLTTEKFKELTGWFEMSDEEAQEYVWQIEALCAILMEAVENNTEK